MSKRGTDNQMMLGYIVNERYPNIFCFSTTRHGGVSQGNYATMNCTIYTGDDPLCVSKNLQLLKDNLPKGTSEIIIPFQTHSSNIRNIDNTFLNLPCNEQHNQLQAIDALMTNQPGICLCISTADCIPILLFDQQRNAIAAIHAGWKGTVAKIASKTIKEMVKHYSTEEKDLIACIGPGISVESFEVGNEVVETFADAGFDTSKIAVWHNEKGKFHIDLPLANKSLLMECGVKQENIFDSSICTFQQHKDFFSARRLGIHSGRILTGITIKKA